MLLPRNLRLNFESLQEPWGKSARGMAWPDEYIHPAARDEEERIWWEHFMIDLSAVHDNNKSERRESLGKRPEILLPLRSHKAPLATS